VTVHPTNSAAKESGFGGNVLASALEPRPETNGGTTMNTSLDQSKQKPGIAGALLRRLLQLGIAILIMAAILFLSAGRLDWVMAWAFLGIYTGGIVVNLLVMLAKDPALAAELAAERSEIRTDVKTWDKVLVPPITLLTHVVVLLVAGLNVRFGWPPEVPVALQVVMLVVGTLGYALILWSMLTNTFFSAAVRIQEDRGHAVVTTGPYRLVRHPGYVGLFAFTLAAPVALGSWWAIIPGGLAAILVIVRTALEDRTLQAELAGYKEYAARVRYRLLPGVW
jgi:protein-S-isoprenylcysteine O-methyltransferase Ste14